MFAGAAISVSICFRTQAVSGYCLPGVYTFAKSKAARCTCPLPVGMEEPLLRIRNQRCQCDRRLEFGWNVTAPRACVCQWFCGPQRPSTQRDPQPRPSGRVIVRGSPGRPGWVRQANTPASAAFTALLMGAGNTSVFLKLETLSRHKRATSAMALLTAAPCSCTEGKFVRRQLSNAFLCVSRCFLPLGKVVFKEANQRRLKPSAAQHAWPSEYSIARPRNGWIPQLQSHSSGRET